MITPRKDARWTDARCDQLMAVEDLYRIASMLNHSSDVVGNIQKLEKLADKIQKADFLHFLNSEAVLDRFGEKK